VTQNQETVLPEVMGDIGKTIEDNSAHCDTEPRDGTA